MSIYYRIEEHLVLGYPMYKVIIFNRKKSFAHIYIDVECKVYDTSQWAHIDKDMTYHATGIIMAGDLDKVVHLSDIPFKQVNFNNNLFVQYVAQSAVSYYSYLDSVSPGLTQGIARPHIYFFEPNKYQLKLVDCFVDGARYKTLSGTFIGADLENILVSDAIYTRGIDVVGFSEDTYRLFNYVMCNLECNNPETFVLLCMLPGLLNSSDLIHLNGKLEKYRISRNNLGESTIDVILATIIESIRVSHHIKDANNLLQDLMIKYNKELQFIIKDLSKQTYFTYLNSNVVPYDMPQYDELKTSVSLELNSRSHFGINNHLCAKLSSFSISFGDNILRRLIAMGIAIAGSNYDMQLTLMDLFSKPYNQLFSPTTTRVYKSISSDECFRYPELFVGSLYECLPCSVLLIAAYITSIEEEGTWESMNPNDNLLPSDDILRYPEDIYPYIPKMLAKVTEE